jgi:hypothetical protein
MRLDFLREVFFMLGVAITTFSPAERNHNHR